MKRYILIAGVNGAGKSTLYQINDNLKNMPRINVDEIVKEFGDWKNTKDIFKAGKIAVEKIEKYFDEGITFNQETTLCGKSVVKNIYKAKELGYFIELHYVGVESVEIAKDRVKHRVEQGGHGIPGSTNAANMLKNAFAELGAMGVKIDLLLWMEILQGRFIPMIQALVVRERNIRSVVVSESDDALECALIKRFI